ncbi:MAG: hypothetical protein CM15mV134_410 [uncultured marine virus]|nr:MAG: hypothetical protein CM15mV134_410 [uncultured marine virus]
MLMQTLKLKVEVLRWWLSQTHKIQRIAERWVVRNYADLTKEKRISRWLCLETFEM